MKGVASSRSSLFEMVRQVTNNFTVTLHYAKVDPIVPNYITSSIYFLAEKHCLTKFKGARGMYMYYVIIIVAMRDVK
jgi:hypothetical protein